MYQYRFRYPNISVLALQYRKNRQFSCKIDNFPARLTIFLQNRLSPTQWTFLLKILTYFPEKNSSKYLDLSRNNFDTEKASPRTCLLPCTKKTSVKLTIVGQVNVKSYVRAHVSTQKLISNIIILHITFGQGLKWETRLIRLEVFDWISTFQLFD